MGTFTSTLLFAFILVIIAFFLLGLGWLVTGKPKIRAGMCGKDPTKKREDNNCGDSIQCNLCEKDKSKPDELHKNGSENNSGAV